VTRLLGRVQIVGRDLRVLSSFLSPLEIQALQRRQRFREVRRREADEGSGREQSRERSHELAAGRSSKNPRGDDDQRG
jgi:hypothetical protein